MAQTKNLATVTLEAEKPEALNEVRPGIGHNGPPEPLGMSVHEYAREANVSPATVYRAIADGEIAHQRIGKRIILSRSLLSKLKELSA